MSPIQTDSTWPVSIAASPDLVPAMPSIVPDLMSDDECLSRLVQAVSDHDSDHLEELARLIGRLAVTIE